MDLRQIKANGSGLLVGRFREKRQNDGDSQDGNDRGKREQRADLNPVDGEHLEGGEGKDSGEAEVEKTQLGEQVSEKEVERSETHDGHDVRGVSEERVASDGEDGGNGVEGEDDVGEFDGDQGQKEDCDHALAALEDEELVLTKAYGVEAGEPGDPAGRFGFWLFGARENETDGGDEQDSGEDVADPLEAGQEAEAGGDEGSAHEDGAEDAPEEGFGLIGGLDLEDTEEEEKEEEIVDGERLFDGVAGEVLRGGLAAHGAEEEEGEGEGGGDPEDGGGDRGGLSFGGAPVAHVE